MSSSPRDLSLVVADSFDLMMRKGDQTCTVQYTGPKNAILSTKEDCVYGVDVPQSQSDLIVAPARGCDPQPRDEETKHFTMTRCTLTRPKDQERFIQVKPLHNMYHVYCPELTITIEGVPGRCPDSVFTIPMQSSFKINNMTFTGSNVTVIHNEEMDHLISLKTNLHLQSSFNWKSLMVDMNKTVPEIGRNDSTYIHVYWSISFAVSLTILILIVIIVILWRKKSNRSATVVVATPAAKETSGL
jgi:hypothetical protein